MIESWLRPNAGTLWIVTQASADDDRAEVRAFLRIRLEGRPLELERLGKDLLDKGDADSILTFCSVLDFPPERRAGNAMLLKVETSATEIRSLSVRMVDG